MNVDHFPGMFQKLVLSTSFCIFTPGYNKPRIKDDPPSRDQTSGNGKLLIYRRLYIPLKTLLSAGISQPCFMKPEGTFD